MIHLSCILAGLLFIAAIPFEVLGALTVDFAGDTVVSGEKVLLSDIANITPRNSEGIALGERVIATSPAPGMSKTLQTVSVIKRLRHVPEAVGAVWSGADTITVARRAIKVNQKQLYAIIAEYLADNKTQLPKGDIRFTSMRAPSELLLPHGEITWKVTPSRPSIADSSSFSIFFKVDGEPAKNCTVRGRVEIMAQVVTATETIRRGTVIRPDHIRMSRKNIVPIDHPVFQPQIILGMKADRTIGKGKVIEHDQITSPPVIESGELVKIIAGKGNMRISTKGVARTSGATGDLIRVKNIRSNKIIHARVAGPGIVSVEF